MIVFFPVLLPALAAALLLVSPSVRARRWISLAAALSVLVASVALFHAVRAAGPIVLDLANWRGPFGISLVADALSALMVLVSAVLWLAVSVFVAFSRGFWRRSLSFHAGFQILLVSSTGALLSGDLFNLYVWFELLLIASFALVVSGRDGRALGGAVSYLVMSLVASAIFLSGIALTYGTTGTLNFADLVGRFASPSLSGAGKAAVLALLFAFALKAGAVPFYFWLPAVYPVAPTPVAAVSSGLLTKIGVYAIVRMRLFVGPAEAVNLELLPWIAGLSLIVGSVGALVQRDLLRTLAYTLIAMIGYLLMGVALGTSLGLLGTVFMMVEDAVAVTAVFLIAGHQRDRESAVATGRVAWQAEKRPRGLAWCFGLVVLSLIGFPPLPGFWSKRLIIGAALQAERYGLALVAVLSSIVLLVSFVRWWVWLFWGNPSTAEPPRVERAERAIGMHSDAARKDGAAMLAAAAALVSILGVIGLWPAGLYSAAGAAVDQIFEAQVYVERVLRP